MSRVIFVAAAALICASPAGAKAQTSWQPVSQWKLDSADERCAIFLRYVRDKEEVSLAFKARPMSDSVTILLETPGKIPGMRKRDAQLKLGGVSLAKSATVRRSSKQGHLLYELGISRPELAVAVATKQLEISSWPIRFELPAPDLEPALDSLDSLDSCTSNLLARWGLSKPDQERIAQYPEPERDLRSYASHKDYPMRAIVKGAIGAVEGRVTIGTDGSMSNCNIVRSSGHETLDQTACRVIARARFRPALDREGKPMTSPYYFQFRWMFEADD